MDVASATASIIAIVELAAKTGLYLVQYAQTVRTANAEIARLSNELQLLENILGQAREFCEDTRITTFKTSHDIRQTLLACQDQLMRLHKKLEPGKKARINARLKLRELKWPFEKHEVDNIIKDFERYKATISLALELDQAKVVQDIRVEIDLAKLPSVDSATHDSFRNHDDPRCHKDTRVDLRHRIREWVIDSESRCVFWLSGKAGTGKSTISRTIAKEFADEGQLAASFFFKRGEGERGNASRFICTIARQLIHYVPQTKPSIAEVIQINPSIASKSLDEQFKKLILEPLMTISTDQREKPLVFVIDALDECDNGDHIESIIRLFCQARIDHGVRLRIFLTSRPELPIREGFRKVIEESFVKLPLDEVSNVIVEQDIRTFLQDALAEIRRRTSYLAEDWPGEVRIASLTSMAKPLFISAATMLRVISDPRLDPDEQLESLLDYEHLYGSDQLATTYQPVLDQLLLGIPASAQSQILKEFHNIIGTIVVLSDSLSVNSLSKLLGSPAKTISRTLSALHSVLDVPKDLNAPVRLFHLSFRDFLTDQGRQGNQFIIDEVKTHQKLAQCCLNLLITTDGLKADICDLKQPAIQREDVSNEIVRASLPPEVRYACVYFVDHIAKGRCAPGPMSGIENLLNKRLLYWFEALAWLGKAYDTTVVLETLKCLEETRADGQKTWNDFLNAAHQFTLLIRGTMNTTPLQIYSSGILFLPKTNLIRKRYEHLIPEWTKAIPDIAGSWDNASEIPQGHSTAVSDLVLSSDGKMLASSSDDYTIKLWESDTGMLLHTLSDHSADISAMAFFSGDCLLVSVSNDGTIRIWNTSTGMLMKILAAQGFGLTRAKISSDRNRLVSISSGVVTIWDLITLTLQTTEGRFCIEYTAAISPTANQVAISYETGSLSILGFSEMKGHHELSHPLLRRPKLSYSREGNLLAALCLNYVLIYDAHLCTLLQVFEGGGITGQFSSNGSLFTAHVFGANTIRTWDIATGTMKHSVAHGWTTGSLSPLFYNGNWALIDENSHWSLWNTNTGVYEHKQYLTAYHIWHVTCSPDERDLFFSTREGSIYRVDSDSGCIRCEMRGATVGHCLMEFSGDGKNLAIYLGRSDLIQVYETTEGSKIMDIRRQGPYVIFMAFTPNGKYLVLESWTFVQVWNVASGVLCLEQINQDQSMRGHQKAVICPRSTYLVCFIYESICVLEIASGIVKGTIGVDGEASPGLLFTPDGTRIVVGSALGHISVWSVADWRLLYTTRLHQDAICEIIVSLEGRYIASASHNKSNFGLTISITHLENGRLSCSQQLTGDHPSPSVSMVFMPNGDEVLCLLHQTLTWINTSSGTLRNYHDPSIYSPGGIRIFPDSGKLVSYDHRKGEIRIVAMLRDPYSGHAVQSVDALTVPIHIKSVNQNYLEARNGMVSLVSKEHAQEQPDATSELVLNESWVYIGGEKMLWISAPYRPLSTDYHNGKLAMMFSSGRILLYKTGFGVSPRSNWLEEL